MKHTHGTYTVQIKNLRKDSPYKLVKGPLRRVTHRVMLLKNLDLIYIILIFPDFFSTQNVSPSYSPFYSS